MALPKQSGLKHWLTRAGGQQTAEGTLWYVASGQRLGETTILVLLGPKNRFGAN